MVVLLLLGYAAICVVIFKFLPVPVNKWSLTTAALGAVAVVGGLLAGLNYNHPFTTDGRIYFYTTAITPTVKGTVTEVDAKPNVKLKQGDLLFRIDPKPYQYVVDQKRAALAEAEQNVKQLQSSLDQAAAGTQNAQTQVTLAQQNYDRQAELFEKKVVAQATLDTATRNLEFGQAVAGSGAGRRGARPSCLSLGDRRRQYDGRTPAGRPAQCRIRSCADHADRADRWLRDPVAAAARYVGVAGHADHGLHSQRRHRVLGLVRPDLAVAAAGRQ